MKHILKVLLAAITIIASTAASSTGESIVLDLATGNYLITYDQDGTPKQVTLIPATKINPTIKTQLKMSRSGEVHYGYELINGRDSQQDVAQLILDPVSSVTTSMPNIHLGAQASSATSDMITTANCLDAPNLWQATMAYSKGKKSFRIGWYYDSDTQGLGPGNKAVFSFKSRDLPGIIQAHVSGYVLDRQGIPAEETQDSDGDFGKQYTNLIANDFLNRTVAVPTLTVRNPFDGADALKQLKGNVTSWPDMMLIDATIASTINASLQTAIDELELGSGNNGAAVRTLKSIRSQLSQMLSNGNPDGDKEVARGKRNDAPRKTANNAERAEANRKLASEVLQFDLKYISRALGSNEKEDEGEDY